jgi:hypothetical protein
MNPIDKGEGDPRNVDEAVVLFRRLASYLSRASGFERLRILSEGLLPAILLPRSGGTGYPASQPLKVVLDTNNSGVQHKLQLWRVVNLMSKVPHWPSATDPNVFFMVPSSEWDDGHAGL